MSEVGDAVELTYSTAPEATVTVTWRNRDTGVELLTNVAVAEKLDGGDPTGLFPVTLTGTTPGMWEAIFRSSGTADAVDSFFEMFDPTSQDPPFAGLAEYQELYGTLTQARQATCRALLRRASQLIRDAYPNVGARIANGVVSRSSVGMTVINMVVRVMRNPAGLASETTGPFSRSYSIEAASGMLAIEPDDRDMLADAGLDSSRGKRKGKVGTARINAGLAPARYPGSRLPYNNGGFGF